MKLPVSIFLFASSRALAHAGCQARIQTAIYCTSPTTAVSAFEIYGFDLDLMHRSNSVALLHSIGCGFVTRGVTIEEIGHGRLPLLNGWAGVTTVALNDYSDGYMADEYLDGKCEPYKPHSYTLDDLSHR